MIVLKCFDLKEFLITNIRNVKFVCPLCGNSIPYTEIVIDPLMQDILRKTEESNAEEVIMNKDGTWNIECKDKHCEIILG